MKRKTILPWFLWAVLALGMIVLLLRSGEVRAEPLFQASVGGVRVLLHNDKCAIEAVSNLPFRATWLEGEKVYEGCWGPRPDFKVVVLYFTDKTIGLAPMSTFSKVTGA
jgi:hypothetical protein